MKSKEQITKEIHEIAREFSDSAYSVPTVAILQPRRTFSETPVQQLANHIGRMVDFTGLSVSFHAIDGNPVDVADCYLIEKALEDNAKYALFIEEDVAVPWHGATRLLETSKQFPDAIIVGVYYVKFGGVMISQLDEKNRWWMPIDATPGTGLRRHISSCGLGCALIPLTAIRKIQAKYPDIPLFCIVPDKCWNDEKVKAIGQDSWFYNLVEKCGIEVICDTRVQCLHVELATGKYEAHPDVNLDDYVTQIPVSSRLTLADRKRESADYISRIQVPDFVNAIEASLDGLVVDYSDETRNKVIKCLRDIPTTQNFYEVARLCERIKALKPKVMLEIGVEKGGTLNLFTTFAPDAQYIGVDKQMQFVRRGLKTERVALIESDSRKALAEVKLMLGDNQVDFLFIDGDHDEEMVRSDFALYSPLVRKDGLIALHDICSPVNSGPRNLWEELKQKYLDEELIYAQAEMPMGIGIIKT